MRALILALSSSAILGACASTADGPPPLTPLSRYTLQVEPGIDRIALAVHDAGLSPTQHAAVRDLAARHAAAGAGWIRVEAPSGDDPVSAQQAYAVRAALQASGVPGERIMVAAYSAPDPRAPVLAGFETLRAVVPNCALEARDMGGRTSNQSSMGFGCAINANMAAQIADPRDILGHRPVSPADSGRSAVVFDNYRKGSPTSAEREELVKGQISRAVE